MLCKGKEVVLIYWLGICSLNYWLFGIPFIFCIKQRRAFVIHDYKMVWKPCLYSHSTVLWLSNHQLRKMIILIGCETGRRRRINWPFLPQRTVTMGWVVWTVRPNITKCNDNFLVTKEFAWRWSSVDHYKTKLFRRGSSGDGIGQGQIHKVEAFRRMYRCGVKINNLRTRLKLFFDHFDLSETRSLHMWTTTRKPSWGGLASLPHLIIIGQLSLYILWYIIYSIVYII